MEGYLTAAAALVVTVFVYAFFATLGQPASKTPKAGVIRSNCTQVSVQPTVMWCGRRGYLVTGGVWSDLGPVTPLPGVPAR